MTVWLDLWIFLSIESVLKYVVVGKRVKAVGLCILKRVIKNQRILRWRILNVGGYDIVVLGVVLLGLKI
mgnify:CR=1 FL=1